MESAYSATIDGHRTAEQDGQSVSTSQQLNLSQRARGIVNIGVGAEVFTSRRLSLLGGLSTDLSAVPKTDPRGTLFNYFPARTNRVAASFGVGSPCRSHRPYRSSASTADFGGLAGGTCSSAQAPRQRVLEVRRQIQSGTESAS